MSEISELCDRLGVIARQFETKAGRVFETSSHAAAAYVNAASIVREVIDAACRPVSAQDGAAGVDGRGGQGREDLGRLTGAEEGR